MKQENPGTNNKDSRQGIIKDVQTPLGFFVLVVLIVEVILGVTANTSGGTDKTYLIIGMLGLIFLLVLLVSGMAIFRPSSLYGNEIKSQANSVSKEQKSSNLLIIQTPKEHQISMLASLKNVRHSFYETALNQPRTQPSYQLNLDGYFSTGQIEYKQLFYQRLAKREIRYASVKTISYKQQFEYTVFSALLHEGLPYFLRYYDFSATKTPMVDIVLFDNTDYYLGGFYSRDDSMEAKVLYSHSADMNIFLKDYWQILWQNSTPIIDDSESIRWDELKRLGSQFEIHEKEFDNMVSNLRKIVKELKKV